MGAGGDGQDWVANTKQCFPEEELPACPPSEVC